MYTSTKTQGFGKMTLPTVVSKSAKMRKVQHSG